MILLLSLYILIIGVVLGSFVTALVYRRRHNWSMLERRSKCPHCQHVLYPKDLIPVVSYLWLGGKCRYCGKAIGRQYILTEIGTALTLLVTVGFVMLRLSTEPGFDWWWLLVCMAVVAVISVLSVALFVYDVRWGELPNQWTLGGAGLALAGAVVADWLDQPTLWQPMIAGFEPSWWSSLLSGVVAAVLFVGIVYFSEMILHKPGMGMGDAKLALLMGFFVGFPAIVVALYVAFIFGAVLSLLLIAGKRKSLGASLPFGPFLIFGMFASLWISPMVLSWYSSLWM